MGPVGASKLLLPPERSDRVLHHARCVVHPPAIPTLDGRVGGGGPLGPWGGWGLGVGVGVEVGVGIGVVGRGHCTGRRGRGRGNWMPFAWCVLTAKSGGMSAGNGHVWVKMRMCVSVEDERVIESALVALGPLELGAAVGSSGWLGLALSRGKGKARGATRAAGGGGGPLGTPLSRSLPLAFPFPFPFPFPGPVFCSALLLLLRIPLPCLDQGQ